VALCCAGVFAAVLAMNNVRGRTTVAELALDKDDPMPAGAKLVSVQQAGAQAVVEQAARALSRRVAEASLPDGQSLVSDAGSILNAWLGGSADDYLAYLEGNGHEPPPADLWADPQRRSEAWRDSTRALREASFDPQGAIIRTSFADGRAFPDDPPLKVTTGWRFNKLSGQDKAFLSLEELQASEIEIREVRIPMRSESLMHGVEFNGLLALSYVQDPVSKAWTLVAVSVYDLPEGDTARIPPF